MEGRGAARTTQPRRTWQSSGERRPSEKRDGSPFHDEKEPRPWFRHVCCWSFRRLAYEALAVRRAVTRVVAVALAAFARAIDRFFVVKQRSSARSTFSSIAAVIS